MVPRLGETAAEILNRHVGFDLDLELVVCVDGVCWRDDGGTGVQGGG